jgi:hypothetical protein
LIGYELVVQMPVGPRQWRLEFFAFILLLLLLTMGLYWIKKFPAFPKPPASAEEGPPVISKCRAS